MIKKKGSHGKKRRIRWFQEAGKVLLMVFAVTIALDQWNSRDIPETEIPPVIARTLSAQSVDLIAMSKDQPVILYFWATWCQGCKFVTPTVNWLSDTYPVVSVALASGPDARLQRYMATHGYQFDTINDNQGNYSQSWGIRVTPSIVIIKDGKIRGITTGITTPIGLLARLWLA